MMRLRNPNCKLRMGVNLCDLIYHWYFFKFTVSSNFHLLAHGNQHQRGKSSKLMLVLLKTIICNLHSFSIKTTQKSWSTDALC